jgi:glutathione S-transferase
LLEEIGEPHQTKRVAIGVKGTAEVLVEPDYLKINPKGRVPALAIGGRVLTAAPAIMTYLARSNPELNLLPQDPEAEARVFEWMNWLSGIVHAVSFSQVARPQRFVVDPKDFPLVVAKGRLNAAAALSYIETHLGNREWATGSQYTLADAYLLFFYLSSKRTGAPMETAFPIWTRLAERTMARPAVQRALEKEDAQQQTQE